MTYSYMGRDSSVGIATRYRLDGTGIESRWGARFFASIQNGRGTYSASYAMDPGSFPGVKRSGCGVDHPPPPSNAEVNERAELYLYYPSGRALRTAVAFSKKTFKAQINIK